MINHWKDRTSISYGKRQFPKNKKKNELRVIRTVSTLLLSTGQEVHEKSQLDQSGFLKKGPAKVHVLHHRQFKRES